jgi:HPt (histidine-containing phosphotransfer) domain-containing protein
VNSLAPSLSIPMPHNDIASMDAPMDMPCVFDLVHLSRQTLGDRSLETELLELFDRQATNAMVRLSTATLREPRICADIAHMLKGSARGVGAFEVAIAADALEKALRSDEPAGEALAALERAVAEARRTVAALLTG